MKDQLERVVAWKNVPIKGTEYCALWHGGSGWVLKGTVMGVLEDGRPMIAEYEVQCDENWFTRRVQVERTIGEDTKTLTLGVADGGVWRRSWQEVVELHGCLDVDLSVTPATNTIPIRRLALPIGESAAVIAFWVKFPNLEMALLSQRYKRTAKSTYEYQSETGFSTGIVVDDVGLVITYHGGWERIATL